MNEIVLGNRKMNSGEKLGLALGASALGLYVTRFDVSTLWIVAVMLYTTVVFALLLRSQRFVILNEEGVDYKPTFLGKADWYAWERVTKIIANSTGVTLHFADGGAKEFKVEESKWFNFRKFRSAVERFARQRNIDVYIQVVQMAGEPPELKKLTE
jgi:hypothetical protein